MTTKRTDVHRPTAMQPEDYDFSHTGTRHPDADPQDRKFAAMMLRKLIDEGHRWAAHHAAGKCDHCGAGILYYAVLIHRPTGELIEVGETCLDGRFEMANDEFSRWRKSVSGNRAKAAKLERIEKIVSAHPLLVHLADYLVSGLSDGSFLGSIAEQFRDRGELSERQIEAAEKAITRELARKAEDEARAEKLKGLAPLEPSRRTITGTILSKKWVDNDYSYSGARTAKILIETAEGYRFWGTLPSAACDAEKGSSITLTATITPKAEEPTFAFFKRPTLA